MASKVQADGIADFSGGFDSHRSPFILDKNQYVLGVNVSIPDTAGGLSNRGGLRCLRMHFNTKKEEDIYLTGNYQGEGWYFNGIENKLLASVNGWIFEFSFINKFILNGRIINADFQNNPNNTHCWITRVPDGAIINDGESLPIFTSRTETRRTIPKNGEIGVGLMGVYVQNRFFYVKQDRRFIYASTINEPLSLQEAYVNNIYGFVAPEDNDPITAIGKQKTVLRDALGGNLSFSTSKNNYAVDVRGDRNDWGKLAGQGVGFVDNTITDLGAISSFSYEAFNGNIYFRNANYGLSSIKLAQFQFGQLDAYYNHSLEASLFFNQDNEILLSKCYTRGYHSKIYTTIAPQLNKDGFIFHNGIIVYAPDIYYTSNQKAQRRFESIFTGVRPWAITTIEDSNDSAKMYIHSFDKDGVNRIYLFDESLSYDIDKDGKRKEIESKLVTRAFAFGDDSALKATLHSYYSIKEIPRDLEICIYNRRGEHGPFKQQWATKHLVGECNFKINENKRKCFCPSLVHSQNRDLVMVGKDRDGLNYFTRQDLFKFKGAFTLRRWVRIGEIQDLPQTISQHEKEKKLETYEALRLYDYSIN